MTGSVVTEVELLQLIYDRLGELLDYLAILDQMLPLIQGLYVLVAFTVVVSGAAIVIYFILRPLLYFIR